ncbi:MAG: phosphoribosylpyrophosphate synthetase [Candidatus Melainabacteria bacterium RIFCSPHIGHO2_02_FULL_34_12]|nr:MAG: phosphoribosylpyrophosphate synthetase [Candidatus Melainabacteria bacterium RIFCSPHIGHO2_02_FULL_34_12]
MIETLIKKETKENPLANPVNGKRPVKIFSGRANIPLAKEICDYLNLSLGKINISPFADGELYVQVEESVRGCDVFLIQPTCTPVNENIMELLIVLDALKRASAEKITVVMPYYGYGRQDRKAAGREPITAKLVADLLSRAGTNRILALDLHATQIMGFFDVLVDHLFATPVLVEHIKSLNLKDIVVVSPDVGGVTRARAFAKKLNDAPIAILDKRRPVDKHNTVEVINIIGQIKGKTCIMVDDMIDTAGTITQGAALLAKEGAKEVLACSTHAVLSGPAKERIDKSPITTLIVTNSIPVPPERKPNKLKVLSVAGILAEAIKRIHLDDSVSEMFA